MASRSCSPEGASPIKRRKFSICDKVRKCSGSSSYVNYCGVCNGNHQKSEEDVQYNCDSGFTDLPELRDSKDFMQAAREDSYSDDDNSDTSSQNSNLSNMSGMNWKPMASSLNWIHKKMVAGANPREVLNQLSLTIDRDLSEIDDMSLWRILINMFSEPPRRQKLSHVNTLEDVISLLKRSQNIIVLTGAGVSVSCGIPDFRSRDGIYARLAIDFPDLPDPHSMFDINYFYKDPRPFYKFAREIYPGQFKPSPCHRFIKLLENHNKLLRNYTQNIDTLEQIAGIENVIECHGSFATASCTRCKLKVTADDIREDIFKQRIPICKFCGQDDAMSVDHADGSGVSLGITARGIMKPDIVFFGEGLPDAFHNGMVEDKAKCDLLIVIGTSLKVRPVGLIPNSLPENVPQILINREPLDHLDFDVELLGDSDVIINQICAMMGDEWKEVCWLPEPLKQTKKLVPADGKWNINMNTDEKSLGNSPNLPTATDMAHSPFPGDAEMCCVDSPSSDDNKLGNHDNQIVPDTKGSDDTYKERHMSIDSAGDSGIGDGSNSIDCTTINPRLLLEDISRKQNMKYSVKCLADLLPSQSYYLELPSRYIFPGAEVCCDEWDNSDVDETSSSSEESDSDSDNCEHEMSRKRRSTPAIISDMCDDSSSYDIVSEGPRNKRFKIEDTIAAMQDSEI